MSHYPSSLLKLIKHLSRLPGIGQKTAERLAMHIIRSSRKEAESLAASILEIKSKIKLCERCGALSDREVCDICNNPHRDESQLCVVEQPADMVAVEKSGAFKGNYHIRQGSFFPMSRSGPHNIRIQALLS